MVIFKIASSLAYKPLPVLSPRLWLINHIFCTGVLVSISPREAGVQVYSATDNCSGFSNIIEEHVWIQNVWFKK